MKTLLPHQIEDAQFLAARRFAGNFSGMGSGKTLTALEAFRLVRELVTDQVIIIGPPISLRMWQSEFEAFCPRRHRTAREDRQNQDRWRSHCPDHVL